MQHECALVLSRRTYLVRSCCHGAHTWFAVSVGFLRRPTAGLRLVESGAELRCQRQRRCKYTNAQTCVRGITSHFVGISSFATGNPSIRFSSLFAGPVYASLLLACTHAHMSHARTHACTHACTYCCRGSRDSEWRAVGVVGTANGCRGSRDSEWMSG